MSRTEDRLIKLVINLLRAGGGSNARVEQELKDFIKALGYSI